MTTKLNFFSPLVVTLENLGAEISMCGSRVTCDPAPVDTDEDWLVVLPDGNHNVVSLAVDALHNGGFKWEGSEHYQVVAAGDFMSWRKGDVNLIVTANSEFSRKHKLATHVCKRLNLLGKKDRIAVFQAILYGNTYSPVDVTGAAS